MIHLNCRQLYYPLSNRRRFSVPDEKVPWNVGYAEYKPVWYTAPSIIDKPWADPEISDRSFKPNWNSRDGKINRQSHTCDYQINEVGCPLNPVGRTGIIGRGLLGRWGPNHAADSIVTQWKLADDGALKINENSKKPVLQFIAIKRRDTGDWAIPGGMVDSDENVSSTFKREFMEEALNSLYMKPYEKERFQNAIEQFFASGCEIFKGYVDDPRNTDNAWMETVACNFHDNNRSVISELPLEAGDDAIGVRWISIHSKLNLYANHIDFLRKVVHKFNAHWE